METQACQSSSLSEASPRCPKALLAPLGIEMAALARREDIVLRLSAVEPSYALPKPPYNLVGLFIHRNQSLPSFGLAGADQNCPIEQVYISPLEALDFTPAHGRAES